MKTIDNIYINGEFVTPHGTGTLDLINPSNRQLIGKVILADEVDTRNAIAAAKSAFKTFSKTTKAQRIAYLERLYEAVKKRMDELIAIQVEEYGGTLQFCKASSGNSAEVFLRAAETLKIFELERTVGVSTVFMEPVGVVGLITPWNSSNSFIGSKLSTAIAAGCTTVIKPSEMSASQTLIYSECLHEAGLPPGVFNIVTGLGEVVGNEITKSTDINKISFTGSTAVGKTIGRGAIDTFKRVTLELGGKSPNILLEDADFEKSIPLALRAGFQNSGQACIAATRLLVPENKLEMVEKMLVASAEKTVKVGQPQKEDTTVGPLVSEQQYERVQEYIRSGMEQGAKVLIGGTGHPEGLEGGNFVKPTIFTGVLPEMRIAQEEIFGPVLSVITYKDEEDAIRIANGTMYGLTAYVSSGSLERSERVAGLIDAGRVLINGLGHDPNAPFGGFKQSGIGREYGIFGLEAYCEPKSIII